MLSIKEILKVLQSYNINSTTYGPSIYENNNETGICLEINDSTFGFLTRYFTFKTKNELETFIKKYLWYKKNNKKYKINLSLNSYEIPNPLIKYTYQDKELELDDMLNFEQNKNTKETKTIEDIEKTSYLINIENLTNYLIELKESKNKIRSKKNDLKIKENELKFNLLEELTIYYGKERNLTKRPVNLDIIFNNNEIAELKTNLNNIKTKDLKEIKTYLEELIKSTKEEELDEKNLINVYSNVVYEYNIDILNKQIDFVKRKIESEKNFNIKGSKKHNIDEELKTFLKTNNAPVNIQKYLEDAKNAINNKYAKLTDIKNAYSVISGKTINLPTIKNEKDTNKLDVLTNLKEQFDFLSAKQRAFLVLYNSFYKDICDKLNDNTIESLTPTIEASYHEIEILAFNENNNHFLANYFKYINFNSLKAYTKSLYEIKEEVGKIRFVLIDSIKVFCIEKKDNKEFLSIDPIFNKKEKIYIVNLPRQTSLLYIPDKIDVDDTSGELSIISTKKIYLKEEVIDTSDSIIVNKYQKITKKDNKNDIIITTNLELKNTYIFNIGILEGA